MTNAIRNISDDTTRAFAEACYNDHDAGELDATYPDSVDMDQWGITEDQWKEAVESAATDLIEDSE